MLLKSRAHQKISLQACFLSLVDMLFFFTRELAKVPFISLSSHTRLLEFSTKEEAAKDFRVFQHQRLPKNLRV